jgi:hypothetical protein
MNNIQKVLNNRKYCMKITKYCDNIDVKFRLYYKFMNYDKFFAIEEAIESIYNTFLGKSINEIYINENIHQYNEVCEAIGSDVLDYEILENDREMSPLFHFYLIKKTIKTLDDMILRFDEIIFPELPLIKDILIEHGILPRLVRKKRRNVIDFYKSNKKLLNQIIVISNIFDISLKN